MPRKPYGMICPITRVCKILEPRWTIAILVGLWAGATKFNDLRREIGSISPRAPVEAAARAGGDGAGRAGGRPGDRLGGLPAHRGGGRAGAGAERAGRMGAMPCRCRDGLVHRHRVEPDVEPAQPLHRRCAAAAAAGDPVPLRRPGAGIRHLLGAGPAGEAVEICTSIPGFDIDLYVETNRVSLLGILLGRTTVARELAEDGLFLGGDGCWRGRCTAG